MPIANNNSANAVVMEGDVTGYAFYAPLGTAYAPDLVKTRTVPTGFLPLGYLNKDGIVNSRSADYDSVTDMNGVQVTAVKTKYEETYKVTFLERNPNTLAVSFGKDNVSTDATSKVTTIKHNSEFDATNIMLLFRYISKNTGTAYEYTDEVVPVAKINKLGDVTKAGVSNYALEVTFAALPDSAGNNAYEYTATVAKA